MDQILLSIIICINFLMVLNNGSVYVFCVRVTIMEVFLSTQTWHQSKICWFIKMYFYVVVTFTTFLTKFLEHEHDSAHHTLIYTLRCCTYAAPYSGPMDIQQAVCYCRFCNTR